MYKSNGREWCSVSCEVSFIVTYVTGWSRPVPAVEGQEVGFTLDWLPAYHGASFQMAPVCKVLCQSL